MKKPVVVEAVQLRAYTEGLHGGRVYEWLVDRGARPFPGGHDFTMNQEDPGPAYMLINTLEGMMRADIGDWIIRGVKGEFYPCKPDIFDLSYDAVYPPPEEAV
jgi:hypothetical protein